MKRHFSLYTIAICAGIFALLPNRVPGQSHQVFIFLHDSCLISQYYMQTLNELHGEYRDQAEFIALFPDPTMDDERLDAFRQNHEIEFRLEKDEDYGWTEKLEAQVTPEAFVVRKRDTLVEYSGRIDNAWARLGRKRSHVTSHELADVLNCLHLNKAIAIKAQPAVGCFITIIKD